MARILIAGCGYVGTALAKRLTDSGHEVWALRRDVSGLPDNVQGVSADLTDPHTLTSLPGSLDFVFYTAGADRFSEDAYRDAYVTGPTHLTEALDALDIHPQRLIFTSSTGVYHQDGGAWVDESAPTKPRNFSGKLVREGERLLLASAHPAIVVRLGGIYGPGRTRLIDRVRNGEARCAPGAPRYINLIHRDDCAGVLAHLITLPKPATCYLAVDCEPADRNEIYRWVAGRLGLPEPPGGEAETERRRTSNKRCSNARLLDSGYEFLYPTFREGYAGLL